MRVFNDILDKQLLDRHECRMGRVDGLIGRLRDGAPPVIEGIELRLGPRRKRRYVIPWSKVKSVSDSDVKLTVDSEAEPSNDVEWWLRKKVIGRIPGGKPEGEEK